MLVEHSATFADDIRSHFGYDRVNGNLIWLPRHVSEFSSGHSCKSWNTKYAGRVAGSIFHTRCEVARRIRYDGRHYLAHRLVWVWHHGKWPSQVIDHINGNSLDNRIENLRDVSQHENSLNQKTPVNNTTGRVGVYWCEKTKRWNATIKVKFKSVYLGSFKAFDEAVTARAAAEEKYGFHPGHGRMAVSA